MYNRTLKDWSAIDDSIKIKDVLKEMVKYVIENEVEKPPHVAWISVEQIIWGKGNSFDRRLKAILF